MRDVFGRGGAARTAAVVAITAVAVGGGTAGAAKLLTGADVKNSSLTGADVRNASLASVDVRDGSLTGNDVRNGSIRLSDLSPAVRRAIAGASGSGLVSGQSVTPGAAGANGTNGANGVDGKDGAPGSDGADGANGTTGPAGPAGANGLNADGSRTQRVAADGDEGFGLATPAGTGGDNGSASLSGGALNLAIAEPGGGFAELRKALPDVSVQELTTLVYRFARSQPAGGTIAPVLKLDVKDATPCTQAEVDGGVCDRPAFPGGVTTLVYEPTYSAGPTDADTRDTLGMGNQWYSTRDVKGATGRDTYQDGIQAIQEIVADNPDMKITSVVLQAGMNSQGAPWSGFAGTVDFLTYGFGADTPIRYELG